MTASADIEKTFKEALQALAQPAEAQLQTAEEEAGLGEQLVQRYNSAWRALKSDRFSKLKPVQRGCVRTLDGYLKDLSGQHNLEFWSDPDALRQDERWQEIRRLAQATLRAFGWDES
jgi:hypothetical protein